MPGPAPPIAAGGYVVIEAPSAFAVLDLARLNSGRIQLLLTDVVLHGLNGYALALDLTRRVVRRTASESAIELVPYDRAYEEGFEDMARRVPDLSKLRALTGYEPKVHLDEILDRVVAYFTSDATRL